MVLVRSPNSSHNYTRSKWKKQFPIIRCPGREDFYMSVYEIWQRTYLWAAWLKPYVLVWRQWQRLQRQCCHPHLLPMNQIGHKYRDDLREIEVDSEGGRQWERNRNRERFGKRTRKRLVWKGTQDRRVEKLGSTWVNDRIRNIKG